MRENDMRGKSQDDCKFGALLLGKHDINGQPGIGRDGDGDGEE